MKTMLRAGVVALAVAPALAVAQDSLSFSAAVDLNYKQLDQSTVFVNTSTGVGTTNEFSPKLWTLNLSPSLSWKGVFLTAAFERSLGDASVSEPTSGGWNDRRYSREENSVTLGYAWRGFAAFVGYLDNTTTTNVTQISNAGVASLSTTEVTEQGPYLGVGYSYRFSSGGSIAASIAVTRADGSSQTRNSNASLNNQGDGDVEGTSYGLSWSAPLTGSLFYRLGLKATRYDFKFTDNLGFPRQTKQNYDAFYLGVANYF
ncbi:MAG TPA: hypothetical protein VL982_10775 [Burkholderiales bacterium]|nr:hypothetical protein [Burkholderiales bacterium]